MPAYCTHILKRWPFILIFLAIFPTHLSAEFYAHHLSADEKLQDELEWEVIDCKPFNELTLCWNGNRPSQFEGYAIFTSLLKDDVWSPWLYTAEWGGRGQMLYIDSPEASFAENQRDLVRVKKGFCTGIRVKVFSWYEPFTNLTSLLVSTNDSTKATHSAIPQKPLESIMLQNISRLSQIGLRHRRYLDLSLPVAMSVAVGQIRGNPINPHEFCESVYDDEFDFYESWILSAAAASAILGDRYEIYVEKLPDFAALHEHLMEGYPVIVGVRGYLPGCARPYRFDHMVCIYGYDATKQLVHAIDPGFPNDRATATSFPLKEFLQSWSRLGNKACIFREK